MPKVVAGYKEEARKTILQHAVKVFAEEGYQRATMDEVANRLGVSKGAVYQYFPSKEALFQELCGNVARKVEETLKLHFVGPSIMKAAENLIDIEFDRMEQGQILMFEALAEAPRNSALRKTVRNNYVACSRVLADFFDGLKDQGKLKNDLDSMATARLLMALKNGVVVSVIQGLPRDEAKKVWMDGFSSAIGSFIP
jgi:AcrR family transcriptional regulator